MMKKYLIVAFSLLLCVTAGAQRLGVREEVRADWNKSSGLDCLLDLSPKALTPVPKGYEAVYISHYGRHGSCSTTWSLSGSMCSTGWATSPKSAGTSIRRSPGRW